MSDLGRILAGFFQFYEFLIFAYVLMSWFPMRGVFADIQNVVGSVVEPYLAIFRRIIPPMGAFDFSPLVAYFVLIVASRVILSLVG